MRADFDAVVLAVGTEGIAARIPLVPGGSGVVKAVIPAVPHWHGAPLAGALVYRAFGTFLPAGAGAIALATLQVARRADELAPRRGAGSASR